MEAESDYIAGNEDIFLNDGKLVRNEEWEGRGEMQLCLLLAES